MHQGSCGLASVRPGVGEPGARDADMAGHRPVDKPAGQLGGGDEGGEVQTGPYAHVAESVGEVLDGNVARRSRGEWAAAEPAEAGVEPPHPVFDGRDGVGNGEAPGVVEVCAQLHFHGGRDPVDDVILHLSVADTDSLRHLVLEGTSSIEGGVDERTSLVFEYRQKRVFAPVGA